MLHMEGSLNCVAHTVFSCRGWMQSLLCKLSEPDMGTCKAYVHFPQCCFPWWLG